MLAIVYSRDERHPLLANFSLIHFKVLQAQSDLFFLFFFGTGDKNSIRPLVITSEI